MSKEPGLGTVEACEKVLEGQGSTITASSAFESKTPDGKPRMSDDFERILERILDLPDALAEYDRLEKTLKIEDNHTDLGTLQKALNEAESNALMASKLHANSLVEKKACEREWDVWSGPHWIKAEAVLEAEAKNGRKKNITDADVKAVMASRYPDEFRDHARRKAQLEALEVQMKKLSELWTQRCATLMTLIANSRRH